MFNTISKRNVLDENADSYQKMWQLFVYNQSSGATFESCCHTYWADIWRANNQDEKFFLCWVTILLFFSTSIFFLFSWKRLILKSDEKWIPSVIFLLILCSVSHTLRYYSTTTTYNIYWYYNTHKLYHRVQAGGPVCQKIEKSFACSIWAYYCNVEMGTHFLFSCKFWISSGLAMWDILQ